MAATLEETPIMRKTRELCETILDQPDMRALRERITEFMEDEKSRAQYENLVNKGQALHQKQHTAEPLGSDEIAQFERERETLLTNPVARNFLDAQDELHRIQDSIQKYVGKTLELGRLPSEEDLSDGCCGGHGGCGCSH